MITKISSAVTSTLQYYCRTLKNTLLRKKSILFIPVILFIHITSSAQENGYYRSPWIFGVTGGWNYSFIPNLDQTILSEPFFLHYALIQKYKPGISGGFFLNFRESLKNHFALQVEASYSQQGSILKFKNEEKDFNYNMRFSYQYLNISPLFKIYFGDYEKVGKGEFWKHFNSALGLRFGFNACSKIFYKSGGVGYLPAFGSDLQQQQQLRNVLKANNNTGYLIGLGYEFKRVVFDTRYNGSFNDVLETQANSYNFIENDNKNHFFQITVSYYFLGD